MKSFYPLGAKNDEAPTYLVSDTTYALTDSELNALFATEDVGAPIGTIVAKSGYQAMKMKGLDDTWTTV